MKAIHWTIAAAALAFAQAAPASAAVNDPEVLIYRFAGVKDDGGGLGIGVATVFHCTNFSGVTESIRFVTRDFSGPIKANVAFLVDHLNSTTVATHGNFAYSSLLMSTGATQGTTAIAATSTNIICTAMTIDAANPKPDGVALRGIRFSPVPGSQE
jgi:hypothetical protein